MSRVLKGHIITSQALKQARKAIKVIFIPGNRALVGLSKFKFTTLARYLAYAFFNLEKNLQERGSSSQRSRYWSDHPSYGKQKR